MEETDLLGDSGGVWVEEAEGLPERVGSYRESSSRLDLSFHPGV